MDSRKVKPEKKPKLSKVPSVDFSEATHAYCPLCVCIQPVILEPLQPTLAHEDPREWLSGDIVCSECKIVIGTLFKGAEQ